MTVPAFIKFCASTVSLMTGLLILDLATGFSGNEVTCNPEFVRAFVFLSGASVSWISWTSFEKD